MTYFVPTVASTTQQNDLLTFLLSCARWATGYIDLFFVQSGMTCRLSYMC